MKYYLIACLLLSFSSAHATVFRKDVENWDRQKAIEAKGCEELRKIELNRNSGPERCSDGSYVSHAPCVRCPDGTYVAGECIKAPNGTYVGN